MLDSTPYKLKGQHYPDHLQDGCSEYHVCRRCMQCANYNKHNATCVECEATKPNCLPCSCSDHAQWGVMQIEKYMKRPMYDINNLGGTVQDDTKVMETSFNPANKEIAEALAGG